MKHMGKLLKIKKLYPIKRTEIQRKKEKKKALWDMWKLSREVTVIYLI